jgi:ABC-type nitrate/sulfonate/bicarbonate transport system ATPase subunit
MERHKMNFGESRVVSAKKIFRDGKTLVHALDNVSLSFSASDFVCLVGPSGCGKSTLLNVLAGFETLDSGEVNAFGTQISGPSIERTMVFQEYALFPWMTVRQNIGYGLLHQKEISSSEREIIVDYYLKLIELEAFGAKYPHQLSGGMRQRVAIARALAVKPKLLLMDEPFAALDSFTREKMQDELLRILKQEKTAVVFVTHSIEEALKLADLIVVMSPRPGRVVREIRLTTPKPRDLSESLLVEHAKEIRQLLHEQPGPVNGR